MILPEREIGGQTVGVNAEDFVVLRLQTQSGVSVLLEGDLASPGFANSVEVHGSNGSAFITVLTDIPDRYVLQKPAGELGAGQSLEPGQNEDMLGKQLDAFVQGVKSGEKISDLPASVEVTRAFGEE